MHILDDEDGTVYIDRGVDCRGHATPQPGATDVLVNNQRSFTPERQQRPRRMDIRI